MKLAIFPGSFKPPHYGHYTLVKKLLEDKSIDKIYVIISPLPRYLLENDVKSGEVTASESEKIWKIYFEKELNVRNKRLYVMISRLNSPIQMAYAVAKNIVKKKGDELILVKSTKNEKDSRFNMFKDFKKKGIELRIWSLPKFDILSSTNMRKTIYEKDKKNFIKFLPPYLSINIKNKIWKMLLK